MTQAKIDPYANYWEDQSDATPTPVIKLYEPPTVEDVIEAMGQYLDVPERFMVDSVPQRVLAAVHEAGHAIARAVCQVPVGAIEIHPDGSGVAHAATEGLSISAADARLIILAGPVAEGELLAAWGDDFRTGAVYGGTCSTDLATAASMSGPFSPLAREEVYARAIVWTHWVLILRVARALLDSDDHRMEAAAIVAIIGGGCDMIPGEDGHPKHSVDTQLQNDSWTHGVQEPGDLLTVSAGFARPL